MNNTTALSTTNGHALEMAPDQIDLIKRTICKGATDEELKLFLHFCNRTGLDPLARQVHAVKRWDAKAGREVMSIQTSIDGFRLIAERTGDYAGQTPAEWCGPDGAWRDVWLASEPPAASRVGVYRKGFTAPLYRIATWGEYAQMKKDGKPTQMWGKMPALMLAKCAESQALRAAFPMELSGLYTTDEMSQADDAIDADVVEEPKRIDPPKPKMPDRPWPARDVKAAIMKKAERLAAEVVDGPPGPGDIKGLATACSNLGLGNDAREKIIAYVFGVSSAKDLTSCECESIIRWVAATKNDAGEWVASADAIDEARAVIAAHDASIGDVIGDGLDAMGQPIGDATEEVAS